MPGDPLAGYLLAAGAGAGRPVVLVMLAALLLYMAGLITNDVADMRVDSRERPNRPLPSRAVDEIIARLVAVSLIALALLLARYVGWATTAVALGLLVCISLYNQFLKAGPLGPLCMGLCRGLSLLLGASVVGFSSPLVWIGAGGLTLYVMAVTLVARGELAERRPAWLGFLPLVAVAAIAVVLLQASAVSGVMQGRLGAALFLLFSMSGLAAWHIKGGSAVPPQIGRLISALIFLQASFCLAANAGAVSLGAGLALLVLWPLNRALARWISPS